MKMYQNLMIFLIGREKVINFKIKVHQNVKEIIILRVSFHVDMLDCMDLDTCGAQGQQTLRAGTKIC